MLDESGEYVYNILGLWHAGWLGDHAFKDRLRVQDGIAYCRYCRATQERNNFNTGIPITDQWHRTQLRQHCAKTCKKHQDALQKHGENCKQASDLKASRKRKLRTMTNSLTVIIRCVFWLCYECIANAKLRSLYKMVTKLPGMSKLEAVDDFAYVNAARCREFAMSLSSTLKGYLWKDILASPFVSVLIDESTDISTSENMIIYLIYLKAGVAIVTYVGLVHVPAVDAEAITDTLLTFLMENGLDINKVSAFCSDGASVMTGHKGGVVARLKLRNPFMTTIHYIAHRLALCCSDAADDLDYPSNSEVTINEVSAYFNRSGKRTVALNDLAQEFKMSRTKIVKSGKTRWLSREGAVKVFFQLFYVLVAVFVKDSAENEVAASIVPMLTSFMFIATIATMADLLKYMATLSKCFQFDTVDYSTVQTRLFQTRQAIISRFLQTSEGHAAVHANMTEDEWDAEWDALLEEDNPNASDKFQTPQGQNVREFLSEHANSRGPCSKHGGGGDGTCSTCQECTFREVTVHCKEGDEKTFKDWAIKFAIALMARLAQRFPHDDMSIMAAMEIFNPAHCSAKVKSPGDLLSYGGDELELLIKHYGTAKPGSAGLSRALIDEDAARSEWDMLKHTVHKHKHQSKRDLWKEQLRTNALDSLPNMHVLICVMLIMPYNTSCCERGFSLMKLIKSALRNRLYIETLDALMTIKLVGKRYVIDVGDEEIDGGESIEDKFFTAALDDWMGARLRNPNMARFGNQNRKRRTEESRTEVPNPDEPDDALTEDAADSGDGTALGLQGLDEAADNDEERAAEILMPDESNASIDDRAGIEPFLTPNGFASTSECPELTVKSLKKAGKFAYKFAEGWDTATFRGAYAGKNPELKGNYDLYFQSFKRKVSVQLLQEEYGLDKTWVVFKAKPKR
jgi:hypothetical protein